MCSPLEMSATGDGSIEVAGRKDGGNPARYLCLYGCRRKIELDASTDIVHFGKGRKRLYCQLWVVGYGKALTKCGDLDTKTKEGKMEMEMVGREMTGVEQGGTSIVGRLCLHLTR